MLGRRLGPYRIDAELGSGGMGTVYLAEVVDSAPRLRIGTRVALKILHSHLLASAGFFKRFLREAEVGRKIEHPNVVTTYDADAAEIDGKAVHFLVVEYVEGKTLRRLLDDLGVVPEALVREIGRQIAEGLAAIHAAGILHRDLKPENVILTPDHQIRIMDLGLARVVESSTELTVAGQFAGSLLYAAPEQFGVEEVTTATDLYAVGVMLYELLVGENPFRRDETAAVIAAVTEHLPTPVHHRRPEVSPFLSTVIASLLAKEPAERFPSAAELAVLLEEGERSSWWSQRERESGMPRNRRPRILVPRESGLHGRDQEMAGLHAAWTRARKGSGNVVLVEGEEGIGKTRLVADFLGELESDDAYVLYGSYAPSGGLGALSDAVLGHFGAAGLMEGLQPYVASTPSLLPGFAAILRHETPPSGAEVVQGDAMHTLMVRLLRGLAEERPVVWVIEDLHYAARDSRKLVLSMARGLRWHRVLLVLTSRPELADEEQAQLSRLDGFRRLGLGRLSPRQVIEVLRDAFRSPTLAERLGGTIAYKSDGVPFFVFEILRGLREGRLLEWRDDGTVVETGVIDQIQVPSAVRDLIESRLGDLSAEERAILDVGAVQGFELDAGLVAEVLERKRIPVLQALATIERRNGVVRAAGFRHRFDHHQIQEILYDGLPPSLRAEYHAALADAYAADASVDPQREGRLPGEAAVFLAGHHVRGSRPLEALPYLDRALDHLEASYRNEPALDLVERALQVGGLDASRRVELLLRQAERLNVLGRRDHEREVLDRAVTAASELEDPRLLGRALARLGWHQVQVSRYDDADAALERALPMAREASDPQLESLVLRTLAVAQTHRGRGSEATDLLELAIQRARTAEDVSGEAAAVGTLGNVLRAQGRYEEALSHHERNLTLAREAGDRRGEITALANLGNVFVNLARTEEAERAYESALDLAHAIGDRFGQAVVNGNLAALYWTAGQYDRALKRFERGRELSREVANRQGEANVLVNFGRLWLWLGRHEHARSVLDEAEALARETGLKRHEAHALLVVAELAVHQSDPAAAEAAASEAQRTFEAIPFAHGAAEAIALRARAARLRGDSTSALRLHTEALQHFEAMEEAAAIAEQHCYIASLDPEHVAAAAESVGGLPEASHPALGRVQTGWLLYRATREDVWLRRARTALEYLLQEAPPEHRESMVQHVPLFHEIWAASRPGKEAPPASGAGA